MAMQFSSTTAHIQCVYTIDEAVFFLVSYVDLKLHSLYIYR